MRLPKSVNICGKIYEVKKNRKLYDSFATTLKQIINFIHEVLEMIACERGFRYGKGRSEDSIFAMTHKEFDNFAADVATAIRPTLKD